AQLDTICKWFEEQYEFVGKVAVLFGARPCGMSTLARRFQAIRTDPRTTQLRSRARSTSVSRATLHVELPSSKSQVTLAPFVPVCNDTHLLRTNASSALRVRRPKSATSSFLGSIRLLWFGYRNRCLRHTWAWLLRPSAASAKNFRGSSSVSRLTLLFRAIMINRGDACGLN